MAYGILSNSTTMGKYPIDLRLEFPNISFPTDLSKATLPTNVVIVEEVPTPHTSYTDFVEGDPVLSNGIWTQTWTSTPWTIDKTRSAILEELGNKKWAVIQAGTKTSDGLSVDTSVESLHLLTDSLYNAERLNLTQVNYKDVQNVFHLLTIAEFTDIVNMASNRVNTCFNVEAAHYAAIMALTTYADLVAYDITKNWPT